jgi:hypothetical protein
MVVVFHDAQSQAASEERMIANFVEYGKRLEALIADVRPGATPGKAT